MAGAWNTKIGIRLGYAHFLKENLRHIVIEMLAGVDDEFVYVVSFSQGSWHYGRLDELGPGSNDSYYFHLKE